jgi:2-polyprenyl-6-methoxyphenol hydroxylase-like FAD-dependent oxidoreductase
MTHNYDIVVIGGGIAGASLAKCMAERGARVLVVEEEIEFRDRVRGEVLVPWGTAEAEALGIRGILLHAGARELRWLDQYMGPQQIEHRDFYATTLTHTPLMSCYHPRMQAALLGAAEAAGAEVRRGITVTDVVPGDPPRVMLTGNSTEEISARLVVVADGRNSRFRRAAGFRVDREEHSLCIAGVLVEEASLPADTFQMFTNPALGEIVAWAPQGEGRARLYLCFWGESRPRLQGAGDFGRMIESFAWTSLAERFLTTARQAGPLATFEGADHWVTHPYHAGVALLGDAAASSDPAWGQGLSLALRGVRELRDALLRTDDWEAAGHRYAEEVDRFYGRVRMVASWFREFFLETSARAEARRARALPLIAQDGTRIPDLLFSGPEIPLAENTRARFFGLDAAAAVA